MTDTPETDAETHNVGDTKECLMVFAEFARKLERERDILRKHTSIMDISHKTANDEYFKLAVENENLERERDEWKQLAIQYSAEREHNAMQSLIYKAERDEARATCSELVADSDAITLARTVVHITQERDEHRKLADDAMATLHEIKVKYGLGERHVMQEKDREIDKLHKIIDEMEILNRVIG